MSDHTLIALSREVAALTVERDRLQQEKDRWFIECERLANGLLDQFEEEADDGEGGLSPFKAVDTAFRLLDDYTALAAAVTQERDTLKQDLEKANTIASNGLDEIRRLVERVQALDAAASWQNIATAPKDGTRVDLWAKMWRAHDDSFMTRRFPDCYWVKRTDMSNVDDHWGHLDNGWMPTHWTLQPAPPAASRREEEPR